MQHWVQSSFRPLLPQACFCSRIACGRRLGLQMLGSQPVQELDPIGTLTHSSGEVSTPIITSLERGSTKHWKGITQNGVSPNTEKRLSWMGSHQTLKRDYPEWGPTKHWKEITLNGVPPNTEKRLSSKSHTKLPTKMLPPEESLFSFELNWLEN